MNRIDTRGPKPVSPVLNQTGAAAAAGAEAARPAVTAVRKADESTALNVTSAGPQAPVDQDRVSQIRHAVEQGRYPVLPAKIADAMIAAGYLLRSK